MREFDRGIILSKKYNHARFHKTRDLYLGGGKKTVTLSLDDNIINLDPTVSHEFQMPVILQVFYPEKMAMDWIFYLMNVKKFFKENHIGFHLQEMIYASFLASLGEITILNCELEENYGNSTLYFLPKDLTLLTEKQKRQLHQLLPAIIEREYVEVCYCNSSYSENEYCSREQLIELIGRLNQENEISKK